MFKVGDKVRVRETLMNYATEGETFTVERVNKNYVYIKSLKGRIGCFFHHRFELVEAAKLFDISKATDQELADEIRRLQAQREEFTKILQNRGYLLRWLYQDGKNILSFVKKLETVI
jgi:hypothetical protein